MSNTMIRKLIKGRMKVPSSIREALDIQKTPPPYTKQKWKRPPTYIKGVSNGNYFRIKIPPKQSKIPNVPKLPTTNPKPKPFTDPPPTAQQVVKAATSNASSRTRQQVTAWFRGNLPILVLNFGSICTLVGFTRSDVLELRSLSITGNILFVVYNLYQNPILWPSIAWSSLFATVNGVKIFEILHERNAAVHMTKHQEEVFVEHFMPHGVTPKQFERIHQRGKSIRLKKGEVLIRSGEKLDHLYLITHGSTQAMILGRTLTAASTNPDTKGDQKAGGDSGAWVGEMAFLDRFWELEQGKTKSTHTDKDGVSKTAPIQNGIPKKGAGLSIYTIIASEDCTIMSWTHDDMAELMHSSTDLRAALTRAMTSALVGKVVNLTVSRTSSAKVPWAAWLADWKDRDGTKVRVKNLQRLPEERPGVAAA